MDWLTGSKQAEIKKLILQLADSTKRDFAAQGLIKFDLEAVPALIDALQSSDLTLLPFYQRLLTRIPSAKPQLIRALSKAQPVIRGRVAEILGMGRENSVIPVLLEALRDGHANVRARAALALSNIGDAKVIPALFPLLKDKEDEVRIAACQALGRFRDPSTFDEIANLLLDDLKIDVRRTAARTLGDTKNPAALPFLMEALRDSFWWYEREKNVVDLLKAIQDLGSVAVEPLIDALLDKEGAVRKFAAMILGELGDVRAIEPLGMAVYDLHHEIGREAAESLALFGSPAVGILLEALRHPEGMVRGHAVVALGRIQDVRVTPAVIERLSDTDREVRKLAIRALGDLRDDRGIAALREIAGNRADKEMAALAKQVMEAQSLK